MVGILKKTATPVDRSLYITLEGMEAMHLDWAAGAPPMPGESMSASKMAREEIQIKQITAFCCGRGLGSTHSAYNAR